jgi:hypothetical protein
MNTATQNQTEKEENAWDLVRASMVVNSHLSDIMQDPDNTWNRWKLGFCKYIIAATSGDLTKEIDPVKLSAAYDQIHPSPNRVIDGAIVIRNKENKIIGVQEYKTELEAQEAFEEIHEEPGIGEFLEEETQAIKIEVWADKGKHKRRSLAVYAMTERTKAWIGFKVLGTTQDQMQETK